MSAWSDTPPAGYECQRPTRAISKSDTVFGEVVGDVDQMTQVTTEAVEFPHDQRVAVSEGPRHEVSPGRSSIMPDACPRKAVRSQHRQYAVHRGEGRWSAIRRLSKLSFIRQASLIRSFT